MEDKNVLQKIQREIGYQFRNIDILIQAFTRKTYSEENGGQNNEVLEFIGDKALDFVVVKYLIEKYTDYTKDTKGEFIPNLTEGEYTDIKKKLVEKETLSERMGKLGFNNYLIMGKGDIKRDVKNDKSVKEDLFEAIIGAVTLDSGWNIQSIIKVVRNMLKPDEVLKNNASDDDNYISLVQEWLQKKKGILPTYQIKQEEKAHVAFLTIEGIEKKFVGKDTSDRRAKMKAAEYAYAYLKKNDMLPNIKTAIKDVEYDRVVNQLQELAQKKYISMPVYTFKEEPCLMGGSNWACTCTIQSENMSVEKIGTSKTEARKNSAEESLNLLRCKYCKK